jgi:hypothetical protein
MNSRTNHREEIRRFCSFLTKGLLTDVEVTSHLMIMFERFDCSAEQFLDELPDDLLRQLFLRLEELSLKDYYFIPFYIGGMAPPLDKAKLQSLHLAASKRHAQMNKTDHQS